MARPFSFSVSLLVLIAGLSSSLTATEDGAKPSNEDPFWQLPDRAIARLGTTRMRHDAAVAGHVLLRGGRVLVSASYDRSLRVWDPETGEERARYDFTPEEGVPTAISRVDDERFFVSLITGKGVTFDADLARVGEFSFEELASVTSGPGGAVFAGVGEQQPDVVLLDAEGSRLRAIDCGAPRAVAWRFSADGSRIAIAGWKIATRHTGTAHVLLAEVATGETLVSMDVGDSYVQSLAFSPDEKTLALGGGDGSLRLLDLEQSLLSEPQPGHEQAILVTEWSADGSWIATGSSRDGKIAIYDGESGGWIHTFQAHAQSVADLTFTSDGERLISCSSDARLKVFDPVTGNSLVQLPGHTGPVRCVDWSPDGAWVATGGFDGTVRLWSSTTWAEERTLQCGPGAVNGVRFSPDGTTLAAVSQDAFLRLFLLETGEPLYGVYDTDMAIFDVAWSPDGLQLATAHADGGFRLHDALSGRVLGRREVGHGFCFGVAFSPDGRKIAAASSQIKLYGTDELQELRPMEGPNAPVSRVIFGATGGLWSASADRRVVRWNVESAEIELEFVAHPSRVQGLALSSSGELVATCGYGENVIRLWRAESGEAVDVLAGHTNIPSAVVFDPTGARAASVAMDGTGLVWKLR